MKDMDLKGVFRGRRSRTTTPEKFLVGSADLACRNFTAFRLKETSGGRPYSDLAYVASIIDVFARYIVGCRARGL